MLSHRGAFYKKVKRNTVKKHNRRRNTTKMARRMHSMKGGTAGVITVHSASNPNVTITVSKKSVFHIKPYVPTQIRFRDNNNTIIDSKVLETGFLQLFKGKVSTLPINTTPDLFDLQNAVQDAVSTVSSMRMKCPNKNKEWQTCDRECNTILSTLIQIELTSTAYMLRTISQSLLWPNKKDTDKPRVTFTFSAELTGKWDNDKDNITMQLLDEKGAPIDTNATTQLINAFGPSASGKTYWAQQIINIFSVADKTFPKVLIAIDGGIYRETSIIYSWIIRATQYACMNGLSNLVSASVLSRTSLFDSTIVKNAFIEFLTKQKKNTPISLYVPETLGSCGWSKTFTKPCKEIYDKYIDIVTKSGEPKKNNWIALFIYQHKTGSDCPYKPDYKCIGCTESGQSRELKEGKKYSSGAYNHSIRKIKHIFNTIGPIFVIHNTGEPKRLATIYDFSLKENTKKDIMRGYFTKPHNALVNALVDNQIAYNTTISTSIKGNSEGNHAMMRYVNRSDKNIGSETKITMTDFENDSTFANMDENEDVPVNLDADDVN